ncbi:hypothetical protein ACROYT_G014353 [Oculina patagonica]
MLPSDNESSKRNSPKEFYKKLSTQVRWNNLAQGQYAAITIATARMSASSFTERNLAGTSRHQANTPLDSNDSIIVGNPQHGIYVSQASMEKIPRKEAKNYALKLFQLLFSREEAETSSVEGKGDTLKKLNPNRMDALRESTKTQFHSKWAEIEASINCKGRMMVNGRQRNSGEQGNGDKTSRLVYLLRPTGEVLEEQLR